MVGAVVGFGSSSSLAGAYGVAVTGTMLVDTLLAFFVIRYAWRYPLWLCLAATGFFLAIDVTFFSATLLKIDDGGWFPLVIAGAVFLVMSTWRRGRERLLEHLRESSVPLAPFLKSLFADPPQRVAGTAVFLTATPDVTPHAISERLRIEHGATIMPSVTNDPLEIDAPMFSLRWTTSASAWTSASFIGSS